MSQIKITPTDQCSSVTCIKIFDSWTKDVFKGNIKMYNIGQTKILIFFEKVTLKLTKKKQMWQEYIPRGEFN